MECSFCFIFIIKRDGDGDVSNDDITYYTDVCFFARVNSDIEIKPLDNESKEIKFYKMDEIPFDKLLRLNQRLLTIYLKTKFQGEPYID